MPNEFKYALRQLARSPSFTLAVIVTLALCIGANTAVMSVIYGLVLRPLPYSGAPSLVAAYSSLPKVRQFKRPLSVAQYVNYQAHADLFSGVFLWVGNNFTIGDENGPDRIWGGRASGDIFDVLQLHPLVGHFYGAADHLPGPDHELVLTESYWESHYQRDPGVIGKTVRLDGVPYAIVAVAPRSLEAFDRSIEFVIPYEWTANDATSPRLVAWIYGRLKPGVSWAQAAGQLAALERETYSAASQPIKSFYDHSGYRVELGRIEDDQIVAIRPSLVLLQIGVGLVLLLGCVNVANLILARANGRQPEFAVRQALGAGPAALVRPLLAEAVLLSLGGAAAGLLLARTSLVLINDYVVRTSHTAALVGLDRPVLVLTLAVSLLVAVAISLLPIIRIWNSNLQGSIQAGSRGASGSGRLRVMSGLLVSAQVALALVLLAGAGLLIRSLERALAVKPGFEATTVIDGRVAFGAAYATPVRRRSVSEQIITRFKEVPGVQNVAIASDDPIGGFRIQYVALNGSNGSAAGSADANPSARFAGVTPGFFDAMGIRIVAGRDFTVADGTTKRQAVIVDRAFADRYFGGSQALGHGVNVFGSASLVESDWPMLVGIVDNASFNGPGDQSGLSNIYACFEQAPNSGFSVLVRSTQAMDGVLPLLRAKLKTIDPSLPLYGVSTVGRELDGTLANRRGITDLLSIFASLALVLAAVGIYAMLAYDVALRTREIGIRCAIGASRWEIISLILRQGMAKAGIGLAAGVAGAIYLSHFMRSQLYDTQPVDPLTFATVTALLLVIALVACYLPAQRASRISPIIALRAE